jgi:hypothetical protein
MSLNSILKSSELCALVQAAYPQFNAEYHWQELNILLGQYQELTKNQARLQKLGWRSIEAGVDQTDLVLNRVLIYTTPSPRYSLEQQGEYAAYISASNPGNNEAVVAINHSEQRILLMPKLLIDSYGVWIMRLLESDLNFALSVGNFDSHLPTVNYDLLEQYKLNRVIKIASLLKGPIDALLLITEST